MSPQPISNKLLAAAMVSIATPRPATENTIADLWVHRGVNKPDDRRPARYPLELRKNKNPAWLWLMPNSFSIVGNSGERMILETKLSRKIAVRKTTGPSCARKDRASLAITILSKKLSFIATFDVSFALAGRASLSLLPCLHFDGTGSQRSKRCRASLYME